VRELVRAFLIVSAGCHDVFNLDEVVRGVCETDAECVNGIERGRCECGACSFVDTTCPMTNRRWPDSGATVLSNRCVAAPVQIDSMVFHTCMLLTDGSPWCWGQNLEGALGPQQPLKTSASTPIPVIDAAGILVELARIETGAFATCALRADKTVACWGSNQFGELGAGLPTGPGMRSLEPVLVQTSAGVLDEISKLSVGYVFACASRLDASVYCWGDNARGQLGDPSLGLSNVAIAVTGLPTGTIKDLTTGGEHACAIVDRGGGALETYCWGSGLDGRLGNNMSTGTAFAAPQLVVQSISNTPWPRGLRISAGNKHTCAIKHSPRDIYCWGKGDVGQLGTGSMANSPIAVRTLLTPDANQDVVRAGASHSCALLGVDTWCWGGDAAGQVGDGPDDTAKQTPVRVIVSDHQRDLTAGFESTCAIGVDTRLRCWGGNTHGQLGLGDLVARDAPTEIPSSAVCPR
jgi:alpha-tubulin suppressor-like RCC1 family protein